MPTVPPQIERGHIRQQSGHGESPHDHDFEFSIVQTGARCHAHPCSKITSVGRDNHGYGPFVDSLSIDFDTGVHGPMARYSNESPANEAESRTDALRHTSNLLDSDTGQPRTRLVDEKMRAWLSIGAANMYPTRINVPRRSLRDDVKRGAEVPGQSERPREVPARTEREQPKKRPI
jgi:hypothetical protein